MLNTVARVFCSVECRLGAHPATVVRNAYQTDNKEQSCPAADQVLSSQVSSPIIHTEFRKIQRQMASYLEQFQLYEAISPVASKWQSQSEQSLLRPIPWKGLLQQRSLTSQSRCESSQLSGYRWIDFISLNVENLKSRLYLHLFSFGYIYPEIFSCNNPIHHGS